MDAKITFQIVKSIGNLTANFSELKKAVAEQVQKYHGVVYTEDQIAEAKKDLASLRAERKKIDDARKGVKAEFIKPYEEFEKQVKETLSIYDSAISEIDQQVKDAENARKRKKKAEIEAWWNAHGVESIDGVTLDRVWDESYLNKTCTDKKWQDDLTAKKNKIEAELTTISFYDAEMINFVLPLYKETLNLNDSVGRYESFKASQKATEEARRQMAEMQARRAQEQAERAEEKKVEEATVAQTEAPKQAEKASKKIYRMTFEVIGEEAPTKELCDLLRKLRGNNFNFKVIESKIEEE